MRSGIGICHRTRMQRARVVSKVLRAAGLWQETSKQPMDGEHARLWLEFEEMNMANAACADVASSCDMDQRLLALAASLFGLLDLIFTGKGRRMA